jgi:hypothetical protein
MSNIEKHETPAAATVEREPYDDWSAHDIGVVIEDIVFRLQDDLSGDELRELADETACELTAIADHWLRRLADAHPDWTPSGMSPWPATPDDID